MYPYLYKEYKSMSEVRLITSIDEIRTLRVSCGRCEAVQEFPIESYHMPRRCFNCGEEIPESIVQAGEHILRALQMNQKAHSDVIKLQLITLPQQTCLPVK